MIESELIPGLISFYIFFWTQYLISEKFLKINKNVNYKLNHNYNIYAHSMHFENMVI